MSRLLKTSTDVSLFWTLDFLPFNWFLVYKDNDNFIKTITVKDYKSDLKAPREINFRHFLETNKPLWIISRLTFIGSRIIKVETLKRDSYSYECYNFIVYKFQWVFTFLCFV